jgi:hypothetical protein
MGYSVGSIAMEGFFVLASLASLVVCSLLCGAGADNNRGRSFLYQPAYALDEELRGPAEPYVPKAGDIYLATDQSKIIQVGHSLATSGAPHHSGIVIVGTDGRMAILESGPFNTLHVAIVDFQHDMEKHEERGEKIWIRHRRTPLTAEQSAELTAWATAQNGKRFAAGRMLLQLTPFRGRGPLRTYVLATPHGERDSYFCSELVLETCVHLGLLSPSTTRPSATYPRDLFFDESANYFLNTHFTLAAGWYPPARWTSSPVVDRTPMISH